MFEATTNPPHSGVSYRFHHGDGTVDPGSRSDAHYLAPGKYHVELEWHAGGLEGLIGCGTVTVLNADGCWIGIGPADGIGWWCADVFCPGGAGAVAQLPKCPSEQPWGCYTGMDGVRYCIDRSGQPVCLVGTGPVDGFAWYCDGRWCDPGSPRVGCPPYPIYGCHPTVDGHTICIDPAPGEMTCTISHENVAVGQITTFEAHWAGPDRPTEVVFDHGDGTRDPRWTAHAYYAAPGSYLVRLEWSSPVGAASLICGSVTVS